MRGQFLELQSPLWIFVFSIQGCDSTNEKKVTPVRFDGYRLSVNGDYYSRNR